MKVNIDTNSNVLKESKEGVVMSKCRVEFEDLDSWKRWFDTGNKQELIDAIEFMERFVRRFGEKSESIVESRKSFLNYAYEKMEERFEDWLEDTIPF